MSLLVDAFCKKQRQQRHDPFKPTTVVVQSFGIGQWLKVKLAEQSGISANVECILPAELIWRFYQSLIPAEKLPNESPFARHLMTWQVMKLLPGATEEQFEQVQRYLDGDGSQLRLYQLSDAISGLLDQYLIYRPDWINDWEAGKDAKDSPWQSALWRKLIGEAGANSQQHRAYLHQAFISAAQATDKRPAALPDTIHVFGLSSLPAIHLQTLQAVSSFLDVNIYFLNPSEHYWGDIVSEKEEAKHSIRKLVQSSHLNSDNAVSGDANLVDEDYLEIGNPLLASMGKQGREFFELLLETDGVATQDAFHVDESDSQLGQMKNDILNLEMGGVFLQSAETLPGKLSRRPNDKSIQIHACHSPMREIEVLHDQILNMIDIAARKGETVKPADIIVMAPNISEYAPYIHSVFQKTIRYAITDQPANLESTLLTAFDRLLSLPNMRLTTTEVIDFLEVPAIAAKFKLEQDDLSKIIDWIKQAGIRWEIDGQEKASQWNLPESDPNTWWFGLKRLLLGFAMVSDDTTVFNNIAPTNITPGDSELLGTLCHIVDLLANYRKSLSVDATPEQWQLLLSHMLKDFFTVELEDELTLDMISDTLSNLVKQTQQTGIVVPITRRLIQFWLNEQLSGSNQSRGFVSGGITFATLVPMRSIPFKVVCLIGMNDGAYPRNDKSPSFDLMTQDYRKGDRSKRHDDRYLFLEAMLSAEQTLYISYIGRSIKDNKEKPPSVLVAELRDYLSRIYDEDPIIEQPLQPFNAGYFTGQSGANTNRLVSYQTQWFNALTQQQAPVAFIDKVFAETDEHQVITVDALTAFYRHPAKAYLTQLGIYFAEDEDSSLAEVEPFELDGLDKYQLADSGLTTLTAGRDIQQWEARQRASGLLMTGSIGADQLRAQRIRAESVYEKLQTILSDLPHQSATTFSNQLDFQNGSITGSINLVGECLIEGRTSRLHKRQLVGCWIKHLFLCASGGTNSSTFVSLNKEKVIVEQLSPVSKIDAENYLCELTDLYRDGLRQPLAFIPETSGAYFEKIAKNKSHDEALVTAISSYKGSLFNTNSEAADRYYQRLYTIPEDLNEQFFNIAGTIFGPIESHREVLK